MLYISSRHHGRSIWPYVSFLLLFVVVLLLVSHWFLLPALSAYAGSADPKGRKLLSINALTLLALVLVILGLFLVLVFRIGRFFMPEEKRKEIKTKYVDAWAEAGKRMEPPKE